MHWRWRAVRCWRAGRPRRMQGLRWRGWRCAPACATSCRAPWGRWRCRGRSCGCLCDWRARMGRGGRVVRLGGALLGWGGGMVGVPRRLARTDGEGGADGAAGALDLAARITRESAELLGLQPGLAVQALCKATAVRVERAAK